MKIFQLLYIASLLIYSPIASFADEFFNGKDLTGWSGNEEFWSVKDGVIIGTAGDEKIPGNQFLWHENPVDDFYLSLKVRQAPYSANAGIQFRSTRTEKGGAHGYQADVGQGWWGTLYHEHGRRILAKSLDKEEKNIKREDWNHYEILAVDKRIWLAINGKITVALRDEFGELDGRIALQIHGGKPQKVEYKELKLIRDPVVKLVGKDEQQLNQLLQAAPEGGVRPRAKRPKPSAGDAGQEEKGRKL